MPIVSQGGPKSWAKADHNREPRWTMIEGQGRPSTVSGVRVKVHIHRGSTRATVGGQDRQRLQLRAKADRAHSETNKGE